jgi:hypothetical protein
VLIAGGLLLHLGRGSRRGRRTRRGRPGDT